MKPRQQHLVHTALGSGSAATTKSDDGSVKRVEEPGLLEQRTDLARQERTQVVRRSGDLVYKLSTPVNEPDDVLEIMAAEVVAPPATLPSLQLRRHEVGRRDPRIDRPEGSEHVTT